jgi:cyclic pyranopterin phosphate synthase
LEVIYYGVDLEKKISERILSLFGIKQDKPYKFGYIGSLFKLKGIELMLKAIDINKNLKFRVLVCVQDKGKKSYEKNIYKKLQDSDKVDLITNVNREDLFKLFYSKINFCIIPSVWHETGPMTLFESLQYNVPVIINDIESMKEKVNKNNRLVFKDDAGLARLMKEIVTGEAKKRGNFKVKKSKKYSDEVVSIYRGIREKKKGLFLRVGYKCNNKCIFCVVDGGNPGEFFSYSSIKKLLEENRRYHNHVVLTGGEPTIRKDFFKILELCHRLGYSILLQTNARMFSYPGFCEKLKKYNLELSININSYDEKSHDLTTGVGGSFRQTIRGIKKLQRLKFRILSKIMLTKINYKNVLDTAKFADSLGLNEIWLVFLTPFGSSRRNFESVVPSYSEVGPLVNETLSWLKKNSKAKVGIEGFPYCCLPKEFRGHVTEEYLNEESLHGEFPGRSKYNCKRERVLRQKQKFDFCSACKFNNKCEGVYKEYVKRRGKAEFKSIR